MAPPNIVLSHNLVLLNWNSDGLKSRQTLLKDFLSRHDVDIACISETHLISDDKFRMPGYCTYRCDQQTRSGGVAILVRRSIQHTDLLLPDLERLQAVGIRLTLDGSRTVRVISAYQRPGVRLMKQDLEALFDGSPTILMGDLNSKSPFWGCRVGNPNGSRLHNFANELGLLVSAPDEPTHYPYQSSYRPDILDIAILHNFSIPLYQTVFTDLDSDHLPVLYSLDSPPESVPVLPRLIKGKVDWDLFREHMDRLDIPTSYTTTEDIDAAVHALTDKVHQAISLSSRQNDHRPGINHSTTPLHIQRKISLKNALRKRWQRHRNPLDKTVVNRLSRQIRRELDQDRIEKYRTHLTDMEPGDGSLWRETKRLTGKTDTIPSLTNGQTIASTDSEKAELLATYLEAKCVPLDREDRQTDDLVQALLNTDLSPRRITVSDFISPKEIKTYIRRLKSRKAPGDDLIPNVILKQFSKKNIAFLVSLYNACLRFGYFPLAWKNAMCYSSTRQERIKRTQEAIVLSACLTHLASYLKPVFIHGSVDTLTKQESSRLTNLGSGDPIQQPNRPRGLLSILEEVSRREST